MDRDNALRGCRGRAVRILGSRVRRYSSLLGAAAVRKRHLRVVGGTDAPADRQGPRGRKPPARDPDGRRCELCRKPAERLEKTECCGRVVCVHLSGMVVLKRSCWIKHARFTLCGAHHTEGHAGDWKTCEVCPKTW